MDYFFLENKKNYLGGVFGHYPQNVISREVHEKFQKTIMSCFRENVFTY